MSFTATYLDKLTASSVIGGDNYGSSVVVSADGVTAAVAVSYASGLSNQANGAIRILSKSGSTWTQTASFLVPSSTNDDYLDYALSMSASGTVLVVGVQSADSSHVDDGKVYIYKLVSGSWSLFQTINSPSGSSDDNFGASVSISGDELFIAVGATRADKSGFDANSGVVYVYSYNGSAYSLQQSLYGSDSTTDDMFGHSVSMSHDGANLAVGSVGEYASTNPQGTVYVYSRSISTWSQQQKITAAAANSGIFFGHSLAMSADGLTLAVGSSSVDDANTIDKSSIAILKRTGSTWALEGNLLKSSSSTSEYFGHSLSMSFDGDTLLAGVWEGDTSAPAESGAAYVFRRSSGSWSQAQRITASDSNFSSYFGYSVALGSRLGNMLIGAPFADGASPSSNSGALFGYSVSLTDADAYSPLVLPNRTISTMSRTLTSLSISWNKAVDNIDSPSSLQYEVRYSTSNVLNSIANFESYGVLALAYTSDISSATVSNLYPGRSYYVNVAVKDAAGNKTLYTAHYTYADADTTPPVPGSSGTIAVTNVAFSSLTLSWTKSTDNYSAAASIRYAVYRSSSNNISNVTDALANGTKIMDYTADVSSYNVTGLIPSSTYYFNVVSEDEFTRKAAYTSVSQQTLGDTSAPIPGIASISSFDISSVGLSWTGATDNYSASLSIMYAVYMSSSNNISTVANAEANGTLISDYPNSSRFYLAADLAPSTTYYFTIIAKDEYGNKAAYATVSRSTSADTTAPIPGNLGVISATASSETVIDLSWTAATDNYYSSSDISYAVYRSSSNNIATVANAEANGTKIMDYAANTVSYSATGLSYGTEYYFTVIAKDAAGNKAAYTSASESTLGDSSAPVPGNSGTISASVQSEKRIDLSWTAASDNLVSASSLEYAVYMSSSNNISTVANMESNGTKIMDYAANTVSYSASSLSEDTSYYFNVIVKDVAGNKAAYSTANATTNADVTQPTVASPSSISVTNLADISLTLGWSTATDNYDNSSVLVYKVYRATSSVLTSVNQIETNGTLVGTGINISSFNVTNLTPATAYYFNVVACDSSNNKSAYTSVSTTTLSDSQPPVAGNSGSISLSGTTVSSISASWTAASDNITSAASLQYALYVSTSNNIGTVADMESNGTKAMDYAANVTNYSVSGLSAATTYYFNVIVKDATGNKAAYASANTSTQADATPPTPGSSGAIISSYVTKSSITLSWTKAVDNYTAQSAIRYEVRMSTSNNIGTVATFRNGTVARAFVNDIATVTVGNLMPNTTYYFNVMAMDTFGNRAVYSMTSATTEADNSGPTVGNSGIVSFTGTSLQETVVGWARASDEATYFEDLEYALYMSSSNNISTVATAEANGTLIMDYELDTVSFPMTDLVPGFTYYFNVLVKDELGNKSAYNTGSVTMVADTTAPVPGNSGSILSDSATTNSVHLSWGKADDEITEQADIAYALYRSMSNNISTVAQMESNGVKAMDYTLDAADFSVTGLTSSSSYYFNVVAKDAAGNKAAYVPAKVSTVVDISVPSPGNSGTISASLATASSVTLSWTKGTDNVTEAGFLMYGIYYSTSNNIGTVAQIESNGTLYGSFLRDLSVRTVAGLSQDTAYYFNIVVKDSAGNKSCYSAVYASTLEDIDPPVPGGSGVISASAISLNGMILSWNRAIDNASVPPNLQYQVRMSTSNNISTVVAAEANGTIVGAYSSLNYASITGLNSGDTYYFNVIVKDAKGNKSVYATKEQKTKNDVIEVPSAPIAVNQAIVVESSIDKIKSLPQVIANPSLSKPRNWAKVHIIYKSTTSAKRVVVSITDLSQMVGTFKSKNAEVFAVHKVIVEDANNNFVTVPASFIMNADNWNIDVD